MALTSCTMLKTGSAMAFAMSRTPCPWANGSCGGLGPACVVVSSAALTLSGLTAGFSVTSIAAAPLVIAVANDVPEPMKLVVPIRADRLLVQITEVFGMTLTTDFPGASRSGFHQASEAVGPLLLNVATVSSVDVTVCLSSVAPTVMTRGSSPGAVMVPRADPLLPAEATMTKPARHMVSTAWSSGFSAVGPGGIAPTDMLITRMLAGLSLIHCRARINVDTDVLPDLPATLIGNRSAPGASPT